MSGSKTWDPHSRYYEDGRAAAKRLKYLIRVILVEKTSDLERKVLIEQIRSDIIGGVKAYLCMLDDMKQYGKEPDFGIWDDNYVCMILYDGNKNMKEFVLDSRKETLKNAQKWRNMILKKATRIYDVNKNISNFIKNNNKRITQ